MQTPVCTSALLPLPQETKYHEPNPLAWYNSAKAQPNAYLCKSLKTPNKLRTKSSHRICDAEILHCFISPPPGVWSVRNNNKGQ